MDQAFWLVGRIEIRHQRSGLLVLLVTLPVSSPRRWTRRGLRTGEALSMQPLRALFTALHPFRHRAITMDCPEDQVLHMNPHLAPAAIEQTIADSSGLSFAQLREAAVLASQFAFERNDDLTAIDLL